MINLDGDIMYKKIIKEIADELDIKYTLVSKDWVIMLEKDNMIRYITGYKFDINKIYNKLSYRNIKQFKIGNYRFIHVIIARIM